MEDSVSRIETWEWEGGHLAKGPEDMPRGSVHNQDPSWIEILPEMQAGEDSDSLGTEAELRFLRCETYSSREETSP